MDLPDSLDWRTKGVITPVQSIAHAPIVAQLAAVGKNFLNSSIETFFLKNDTLELVESLHAIKTKSLEEGSINRLLDCCPLESNPFECITKLEGICHAADYPSLTGQCEPNKCQPFTRVCMHSNPYLILEWTF
jgi:hypothetical protein